MNQQEVVSIFLYFLGAYMTYCFDKSHTDKETPSPFLGLASFMIIWPLVATLLFLGQMSLFMSNVLKRGLSYAREKNRDWLNN